MFNLSVYTIYPQMMVMMMCKIIEINNFDQFLELEDCWNKVLKISVDNNPYLTWEFLLAYWRYFGKGKKLRILCAEEKGEIVGIAPLRQARYNFVGPLGYTVIEPMGSRGLMPEGGDYTGVLIRENKVEYLKMFLNYLVEEDGWDFIYLLDVPETSIIYKTATKKPKLIPLRFEIETGSPCYYLPLTISKDIFMNELSSKFRKNLGRCMRNLQKDYGRVEIKSYTDFDSVEEAMITHFDLNHKRWTSKNMHGTFSTQRIRDFYVDMAEAFADKGWLALFFLTVDDKPVAGLYCFEYNQKMLEVVSGFDPDYEKYSVGNLLHSLVIKKCIDKKLVEYDFLKGNELYKSSWTAKYRRNFRITLVNKRFTSSFYHLGINTAKKLKIK